MNPVNFLTDLISGVFAAPKWRNLPDKLAALGLVGAIAGFVLQREHFGFAYLLAFMFFLSLCLGSLFLVMVHHLFDASWSVPVRRLVEHGAMLAPVLAVLFLPVAFLATSIYGWMTADPHVDHALHVKRVLFNVPTFYGVSAVLFVVWTWLAFNLRRASLRQDEDGSSVHTRTMRRFSAFGIFLFALSLTMGAIYWMKSLQHQWFSTMYGVYYFAASVWTTLATLYLLAMMLDRSGALGGLMKKKHFHSIGTLFFAFTVFYAYVTFSQYFLIWNAAIPEETFWYVLRERGSWKDIGQYVLIFGHFFVPFLFLLRIDAKLNPALMTVLVGWAWLMHYVDLSFNIMPVAHPGGFPAALVWVDLSCVALIGGVFGKAWVRMFEAHPAYPQADPRMAESLDVYVEPATAEKSAG